MEGKAIKVSRREFLRGAETVSSVFCDDGYMTLACDKISWCYTPKNKIKVHIKIGVN